jgi:hypothetical protein
MKTITAVFLSLVFIVNLQAQDQLKKGVYSLSGSLAYTSYNAKMEIDGPENFIYEIDESTLIIFPKASLFVFDRIEGSLGLGYYRSSATLSPASRNVLVLGKSTELEVSSGLRYYFPLEKIAPFIGAEGGMYWRASEGRSYSKPVSDDSFMGGMEIFISKAAAVEPAISYLKHVDEFTTSHSFIVSVGVKYFIF